MDISEEDELLAFLSNEKHKKKFNYIVNRILEQSFMYYDDYEQIEGNITCMRFFPNGINVRIYCKEILINDELFCVVMSKIAHKKTRAIGKIIQSKIDSLKTLTYDIKKEDGN